MSLSKQLLEGGHHLINEFFGHDVQFPEIFLGEKGKIPLACGAKFSFFVFNLGAYNGVSLVDAFFDKSGHRDCLTNGDRIRHNFYAAVPDQARPRKRSYLLKAPCSSRGF